MNLEDLIIQHAASSYEKQLHFANMLGENLPAWAIDANRGIMRLGEMSFAIQLLGTESELTKSWLWAWANEETQLPPDILKASKQIRNYGKKHKILELSSKLVVPIDTYINGQHFAMIASALYDGNAYFRAPFKNGAWYVLIKDDNFVLDTRPPMQRIIFTFPQLIQSISIPNHMRALKSYAQSHKLTVSQSSEDAHAKLIIGDKETSYIEAVFDESHRLQQFSTSINPEA